MNIAKLKQCMEIMREGLGNGLLAADIYSSRDGQPILALDNKPQPVADALFNNITQMTDNALRDAKFPTLDKYYIMNLKDNKTAMVIPLGEYQWGMLIDNTKTQLGLVLNVVLPKVLAAFEEARQG